MMNRIGAAFTVFIIVGCAVLSSSTPRDPSRQIFSVDLDGPYLNNKDLVCVKYGGLFKNKCVEWQNQVINRYDLTNPADRKELNDRRVMCLSIDNRK